MKNKQKITVECPVDGSKSGLVVTSWGIAGKGINIFKCYGRGYSCGGEMVRKPVIYKRFISKTASVSVDGFGYMCENCGKVYASLKDADPHREMIDTVKEYFDLHENKSNWDGQGE